MSREKITDPSLVRVGDRFTEDPTGMYGEKYATRVFVVKTILDGHIIWEGVDVSRPAPMDLVLKHMSRVSDVTT